MSDTAGLLIVIPCLDEIAHIERLIGAMLADAAADVLLVVADGGSTDGSRDVVHRLAAQDGRVRLLDNPRRIQSAGVNDAVRRFGAGRRWLLRVDAHAGYPLSFAAGLLAAAERTGAQAVVVPMATRGVGCFQRAAAAAQNSVLGAGGSAHRKPGTSGWVDHGHHALMDIARFAAVGGYDETFSHNEDAELDARFGRTDVGIWLAGDVVVIYHPRRDPLSLWRQYFGYGRGRARNLRRHRRRMKLRQALPLAVCPAVALAALTPWAPLAGVPAAVWTLACLGLGVGLGVLARDRCAVLSGPAAMVMHLAWSAGFWRERLTGGAPAPEPSPFRVSPAEASPPPS